MKKRIFFIVILLIGFCGIILFKEPLKNNFFSSEEPFDFSDSHFPWAFYLISTVCFLKYEVPTDIETFIQIAEKCIETDPDFFSDYPGSLESINKITLPNLKKYKDEIFVMSDYMFVNFYRGEDTACVDIFHVLPCNSKLYIGDIPLYYYKFLERFRPGRYFDKDNFPIIQDESIKISEDFLGEKEKLDNQEMKVHLYEYYVYEDRSVPIYDFLEYRKGDKLYKFCENHPLQTSLSYYKKLEELAENICQKYNLSRFIFMSLNYLE